MKKHLLSIGMGLLLVLVFATNISAFPLEYLLELNPALAHYELNEHFTPQMGMHMIVPGPHLTVVVAGEGTVVGVELIVPEEQGWLPWFDQPEGEPTTLPIGVAYTQHIYLADRTSINLGQKPALLADIPTELLTLSQLKQINPALDQYMYLSEYVPGRGRLYGPTGAGLGILVDNEEVVRGFELAFPAEAGWRPWFDQPEGEPQPHPELGQIYSQSIRLAAVE
ncbi:MAG: hypothetical protein ACQEQG_08645 [Bacillota bacterium]